MVRAYSSYLCSEKGSKGLAQIRNTKSTSVTELYVIDAFQGIAGTNESRMENAPESRNLVYRYFWRVPEIPVDGKADEWYGNSKAGRQWTLS